MDYRKKGALIVASLLEDLAFGFVVGAFCG